MVRFMYGNSLCHHGIKGQKWGVRKSKNYDRTRSPKEKKTASKSKKYLKVGAGIVATLVISYAGYKLTTSPNARAVTNRALYGSKEKRMSELSKAIDNMGPELVRKGG